jgi:hypothetical protein
MSVSHIVLGILALTVFTLAVAFAVLFSPGPANLVLAPELPHSAAMPMTTTTEDSYESFRSQ